VKKNKLVETLPWQILATWSTTRLLAGLVAVTWPPTLILDFYAPFAESFLETPSFDPWANWVSEGGGPEAFPYSWPMLFFVVLAVLIGELLQNDVAGWLAVILGVDLVVTTFISRVQGSDSRNSIPAALWVLSPTPLIGLAYIGSLDFIPAMFFVLGLVALKSRHFTTVGLLFGLAMSSKIVTLVAVFALFVYALRSRLDRREAAKLMGSTVLWTASLSAPMAYSTAYLQSFVASPAASGPLTWGVGSQDLTIFLWPIFIATAWLSVWRLRRFSFELLVVSVAIPLVLTAAMPGAAPGWAIWSLPLILPLLTKLPMRYLFLGVIALNASAVGHLVVGTLVSLDQEASNVVDSLLATFVVVTSTVFAYLGWRELATKSDFFRLHLRPALILVAGDSGAGKDTLADGLTRALGVTATTRLSGDDYHLWDRGQGSWQYVTHLNPQANDLTSFFDDTLTLASGEMIRAAHYDHSVGRRVSPRKTHSKEFIIVTGLHALSSNEVNAQASLTVFLEMEEQLRVELKLARDISERSQTEAQIIKSLERRRKDSVKFVKPQERSADLVVKISKLPSATGVGTQELSFESSPKLFDNRLVSELSSTCNLEVLLVQKSETSRALIVRGEADSTSLGMAFARMDPRVDKVLQLEEAFSDGPPGVIQLVTLVYLSNALRLERLI